MGFYLVLFFQWHLPYRLDFKGSNSPILKNSVIFLVCGALLCLTGVSYAQSDPEPINTFWNRLGQLQQAIDTAAPLTEITAFADQFENESTYLLPDGREVTLVPKSLVRTLRQDPPNLDTIRNQITAMVMAQNSWESGDFSEAELAQLVTILEDPRFDYDPPETSRIRQTIENFFFRVYEFFSGLLPESVRSSDLGADLLFGFGLVGFILIMLYAINGIFRSIAIDSARVNGAFEDEAYLTADTALERAQSFSDEGDLRTAVRYLYLSALLLLEERGLLRYDRSQTNREYLMSVRNSPELAAILRDVIDVFDRVWYGFQPLAVQEYNEYARRVETLKSQRGNL